MSLCAEYLQIRGLITETEVCGKRALVSCFCCICGKDKTTNILEKDVCCDYEIPGSIDLEKIFSEKGCKFLGKGEKICFVCVCGNRGWASYLEFLSGKRCKSCNVQRQAFSFTQSFPGKEEAILSFVSKSNKYFYWNSEIEKKIKGIRQKTMSFDEFPLKIRYKFSGVELDYIPDLWNKKKNLVIEARTEFGFLMEKSRTLKKLRACALSGYNAKLVIFSETGEKLYFIYFPQR